MSCKPGYAPCIRHCPAGVFFLIHWSHSISFTRAQGIPKYKGGFGRGKGWESWGKMPVTGGGGNTYLAWPLCWVLCIVDSPEGYFSWGASCLSSVACVSHVSHVFVRLRTGVAVRSRQVASSIHVSKSLSGPWAPLSGNTLPSCNNPAPLVHPNGTLYVVCNIVNLYSAPHITGKCPSVQQPSADPCTSFALASYRTRAQSPECPATPGSALSPGNQSCVSQCVMPLLITRARTWFGVRGWVGVRGLPMFCCRPCAFPPVDRSLDSDCPYKCDGNGSLWKLRGSLPLGRLRWSVQGATSNCVYALACPGACATCPLPWHLLPRSCRVSPLPCGWCHPCVDVSAVPDF